MKGIYLSIAGAATTLLALTFIIPTHHLHPDAPGGGPVMQSSSRITWEHNRMMDPSTGQIPAGARRRAWQYAQHLPVAGADRGTYSWQSIGPWNVGGRTRAIGVDIRNDSIMIAGQVSGGIWRSVDAGDSWSKSIGQDFLPSVTALVQDIRSGHEDTWYACSGEGFGNSATESFSAAYYGDGLYVSHDNGQSWSYVDSTHSGTPIVRDIFDETWDIAMDPTAPTDSTVIYIASFKGIYRSNDGGDTWKQVLNGNGFGTVFTDVEVSSMGVVYATISSVGSQKGIWRSPDGLNWTRISNGSGWPTTSYYRVVIGIDPNNENKVYFLSNTPNAGQQSSIWQGTDWNSLWVYRYLSGDGSGSNGVWTDLSAGIPNYFPGIFDNFNAQYSYNLCVAVKPGDSMQVFIGGTNLYRSTDGFTTPNNTTFIAGYQPQTDFPVIEQYPNQHPDMHEILFLPSDPNVMINTNDGGIYRTDSCSADSVRWTDLNRGYQTSQFYTLAIDHGTPGSRIVCGGMQDNGTWWTKTADPTTPWTHPNSGDGSYCAVPDGIPGNIYYMSIQNGKVYKLEVDTNGNRLNRQRIDPIAAGDYLFINPFVLDPNNNDIMYLAEGANLWRNDSLTYIPFMGTNDSISMGWVQLNTSILPVNANITQLACSRSNPAHRVYFGTNNRHIYRVDNADSNPVTTEVTNNISSGAWTSAIDIDPRDADKVLICFSNYNVYSIWYTTDGGNYWMHVSGNLEGPANPPAPPYINDGPSVRWVKIIPIGNKTVFLAATSVGLFSTDTLIADTTAGDSTIWVRQDPGVIGNVVVENIEYRPSDGFTVITTHGNGAYSTSITSPWGASKLTDRQKPDFNIRVYPNPVDDNLWVRGSFPDKTPTTVSIYTINGKKMREKRMLCTYGRECKVQFKTLDLRSGVYLVSVQNRFGLICKKVMVSH